jgi:hypothetical protein
MAFTNRTILINLGTQGAGATVIFVPELAAGDDQIQLRKSYSFTMDANGEGKDVNGDPNVFLPTKSTGAILFTAKLPTEQSGYYSKPQFYLTAGGEINLSDLIEAGLTVPTGDPLYDYVDTKVTTHAAHSTAAHFRKILTNNTFTTWH